MSRNHLVTGGTGFIGSAVVRALVKRGDKVRSLDNNWRGSRENLQEVADDVEMVTGDIRDPDVVSRAVSGVDCVCHLAAINGTEFFYSKPELVLEVAVKGMINVLDACKTHKVRDLMAMSSSEVYQTPPSVPTDEKVPFSVPDPLNPRYSYGGGKIISELLTLNYGRKDFDRVSIIRPHNVYGPAMGWEHVVPQFIVRMNELLKESGEIVRFPVEGSGQETRAFVYISDMAEGTLKVLERGEHLGIYNIGSDKEITIEQLACEIGQCFERKLEIVPGSEKPGGTPRRCPDISKARAIGYEPKVCSSACR